MKNFLDVQLTIDLVPLSVRFTKESMENVLIPLLKRLTDLQKSLGRRIIVTLGAPAGAGKSVLLAFLEKLSRENPAFSTVQALGLDGFHHTNAYLCSHETEFEGKTYNMRAVKGWPETFDVEKFKDKLLRIRRGEDVLCPLYDRNTHEPTADCVPITADIVIAEGLWVMYDHGAWKRIEEVADYRIMLLSRVPVLRERAVARKVRGGMTEEAALAFFNSADLCAVRRIVSHMAAADLYLESLRDDDLIDLGGRPQDTAPYWVG